MTSKGLGLGERVPINPPHPCPAPLSMYVVFDVDNVAHRRAVKAAARTLGFPIENTDGPARFMVRVAGADDAYRLGLETMKRWRASLGRM
jgi:hypothetical protein